MPDLGNYSITRQLNDATSAAVRRDINGRALAGEWLTAHEALLSAFDHSSFEHSFFKSKARLTPAALTAAREALQSLT